MLFILEEERLKLPEKKDRIMKIAVTYENGNVFPHFGHTKQFKVYEVENGKVSDTEIVDTEGSGGQAAGGKPCI